MGLGGVHAALRRRCGVDPAARGSARPLGRGVPRRPGSARRVDGPLVVLVREPAQDDAGARANRALPRRRPGAAARRAPAVGPCRPGRAARGRRCALQPCARDPARPRPRHLAHLLPRLPARRRLRLPERARDHRCARAAACGRVRRGLGACRGSGSSRGSNGSPRPDALPLEQPRRVGRSRGRGRRCARAHPVPAARREAVGAGRGGGGARDLARVSFAPGDRLGRSSGRGRRRAPACPRDSRAGSRGRRDLDQADAANDGHGTRGRRAGCRRRAVEHQPERTDGERPELRPARRSPARHRAAGSSARRAAHAGSTGASR